MVRVTKDPEERKSEIMDIAWKLFNERGYEQTSVNEIIENAGIAKGTFYYYFKSKEEILDAVIKKGIEEEARGLTRIVEETGLNAIEKFKKILYEKEKMHSEHQNILDYLHKKENIVLHQKALVQSIKTNAPVIAEIIKQGIAEKYFKTDYPLEVTEFLLIGMSFLFDRSIFTWSKEEFITRINALQDLMEATLRTEKGCFSFLSHMADGMYAHHTMQEETEER